MPLKEPRDAYFPHAFRGLPVIVLNDLEWRGDVGMGRRVNFRIVRHATTPPQRGKTHREVWLRYGVHFRSRQDTGTALWQCRARILQSKVVGTDDYGDFYTFSHYFALFGDEERASGL